MTRITSTILAVMLLMNGGAAVMEVSGLSEDIGINIETGIDQQMDQFVDDMKKGFNPNVNIIESFISLALAGLRVFFILVEALYAAPTLMMNLLGGSATVNAIVAMVMAPLYMISTLEMLYMASGRSAV